MIVSGEDDEEDIISDSEEVSQQPAPSPTLSAINPALNPALNAVARATPEPESRSRSSSPTGNRPGSGNAAANAEMNTALRHADKRLRPISSTTVTQIYRALQSHLINNQTTLKKTHSSASYGLTLAQDISANLRLAHQNSARLNEIFNSFSFAQALSQVRLDDDHEHHTEAAGQTEEHDESLP